MFMPDGDPEGLRLVTRSNWTGIGVVFSRGEFPEVKKRDEFSRTGVYILVGQSDENELPIVYIGEGDPVLRRLEEHYRERDFWTWGVFFVTTDSSLNKAHGQYLETRLVAISQTAKRCLLENKQTPQKASLTEWESADMEAFLEDILLILPLLGLDICTLPKRPRRKGQLILYLKSKGIEATGFENKEGFVVLKSSQAYGSEVTSCHRYIVNLRTDLVSQNVLTKDGRHFVFTQDYTFNSPSTAAGVVQGRSANGRLDWQDASGRTLRAIQEAIE